MSMMEGLRNKVISALNGSLVSEPEPYISVFLYVPKAILLIPAHTRAEAGFYLEAEPVEKVPLGDVESTADALRRGFGRKVLIVPTPTKFTSVSKLPSVVAAGARSYADFVRNALLWNFERKRDGMYEIQPWISPPGKSHYVSATEAFVRFPATTSLRGLSETFIEMAIAAQREHLA